jgi:hypothetical protein
VLRAGGLSVSVQREGGAPAVGRLQTERDRGTQARRGGEQGEEKRDRNGGGEGRPAAALGAASVSAAGAAVGRPVSSVRAAGRAEHSRGQDAGGTEQKTMREAGMLGWAVVPRLVVLLTTCCPCLLLSFAQIAVSPSPQPS